MLELWYNSLITPQESLLIFLDVKKILQLNFALFQDFPVIDRLDLRL